MRKIALLMCSCVLLSACASTPENVKNKNESKADELTSVTDASQIKKVKISELQDTEQLLKELETDNIIFSDDLEVEIPNRINDIKIICTYGFEDNYKKIFTYYDEDYKENNLSFDENSYPTGKNYKNSNSKLEMDIGCTGFFTYCKNMDFASFIRNEVNLIENDGGTEITYSINDARKDNNTYKMLNDGNEMNTSDAVKCAEEFADNFAEISDYPNEFKPSRLNVCYDGKAYFYKVEFSLTLDGVQILEYNTNTIDDENEYFVPVAYSWICSNELNVFNTNASFEVYEDNGEIEEIPDLVETAKYLSKGLASGLDLKISRVALEYQLNYIDNVQPKTEGVKTDREAAPWSTFCSYDTFEARPCWVFYANETKNKEVFAIVYLDDMSVYYVNNG